MEGMRGIKQECASGRNREALAGADVCVAFSAGGVIQPEWIKTMAKEAIVFACANPVPEIWPWEAKEAGARIVATGRSDFPNQVKQFAGVSRHLPWPHWMSAPAPFRMRWPWPLRWNWRPVRRSGGSMMTTSFRRWT